MGGSPGLEFGFIKVGVQAWLRKCPEASSPWLQSWSGSPQSTSHCRQLRAKKGPKSPPEAPQAKIRAGNTAQKKVQIQPRLQAQTQSRQTVILRVMSLALVHIPYFDDPPIPKPSCCLHSLYVGLPRQRKPTCSMLMSVTPAMLPMDRMDLGKNITFTTRTCDMIYGRGSKMGTQNRTWQMKPRTKICAPPGGFILTHTHVELYPGGDMESESPESRRHKSSMANFTQATSKPTGPIKLATAAANALGPNERALRISHMCRIVLLSSSCCQARKFASIYLTKLQHDSHKHDEAGLEQSYVHMRTLANATTPLPN